MNPGLMSIIGQIQNLAIGAHGERGLHISHLSSVGRTALTDTANAGAELKKKGIAP
jgi:hypothetical protein